MSRYYDDPRDQIAFDNLIDVMVKLLQKYGDKVLESQANNTETHPVGNLQEEREDILKEAA